MMQWENFGRMWCWPNRGTGSAFPGGAEEIHLKSFRITDDPAKV